MNKGVYKVFSIYFILSIVCAFSVSASELYPDPDGFSNSNIVRVNNNGIISVHVLNTVPCEDHNKVKEKLDSPAIPKSFYVLENEGDSAFRYVTNLKVMLTLLFSDGKSSCFFEPLPKEERIVSFNILFLDRASLDSVSVQIQGISFLQIAMKNGEVEFLEDSRCVSLGSIWHHVKPGTKGWLYQDTLYTVFKKSSDYTQKHPYHLYLASPYAISKPAKL